MTKQPANPTTLAARRYVIAVGIAMVAYAAILILTRLLVHNAPEPWEALAAGAPFIPLVFVFVAVVRYLANTDELARRIIVESLAAAAGLTALLAAGYGLLEGDPLPHPSAWWTWCALMGTWLLSSFVIARRYR
ncbi:MAG: hypothetical protein ACREM6_11195 [Vulcanimicrobiaceae bacterium]